MSQVSKTSVPYDRRSNCRYQIKTPMRYRRCERHCEWTSGDTVEMSARGLLVDIAQPLPVGAKIQIEMNWTGLYHGKETVRLFLTGSVVRVDGRGTALRILNHQFRELFPSEIPLRRPRSGHQAEATGRWRPRQVSNTRAIA